MRWVNSHPKLERDVDVSLPEWSYVGNAIADVLATYAARAHEVPDHLATKYKQLEEESEIILKRITSITV